MMLKKRSTFLVFLLAFVSVACFAHEGFSRHYDDFTAVFNGYGDDVFRELSQRISSGIDAYTYDLIPASGKKVTQRGLPGLFKDHFGKVPGNHRVLGHAWSLNDDIPKEALNYLCETYPGREKEIIDIWRNFARRINSEAVRLTGLPEPQAKALASLLYNIHLLGDLEPDNKLFELVLPEGRIVRNIEKDVEILFKDKPQYFKTIQKHLSKVLRSSEKNRQVVAQSLMTEMYSLRMGEMLYSTYGNSLKTFYSLDRAIEANARRVARPVALIPGMKMIPRKAADFSKIPGVAFARGLLQEFDIGGKIVRVLSVPTPQGAGFSAGVLTLVFTEGGTVYRFSRGTISEDEFIKESVKNCGNAIIIGTATYALVALGATPTGWTVIGVGIAAELVYDVAFEYVYKEFARPEISMQDILGKLPTDLQRRTGVFNDSGFDSFLEYNNKKLSSLEFTRDADSPLEHTTHDVSPLEPYTKEKSPLEIGVE